MSPDGLNKILKKMGWSQTDLARHLGVSKGAVSMWLSGKNPITEQTEKLIGVLTGNQGTNTDILSEPSTEYTTMTITVFDWGHFLEHRKLTQYELADTLDVKQPYISQLKREYESGKPVPKGILEKLQEIFTKGDLEPFLKKRTIRGESDSRQYGVMRPYYDIDFMGTSGAELLDQAGRLEPDNYISVPHFRDVDFYTRITGDSMHPKYRHGDIIACKEIDPSGFFVLYEAYAIITRTNNMRLIKYIHPHPEDESKLLLVSYDENKFAPQPIEHAEILKLFQIKGKIEL